MAVLDHKSWTRNALLIPALLCAAMYAQQPASTPAAVAGGTVEASSTGADEQALAMLRQHHPQEALTLLQKQIAEHPNDATANLLASTCAIELDQPNYAVQYAERARTLDPDSWRIHTTLVTAYAIAGKTQERDAERATLRTLHTAGKEADASRASGFLLDEFKVNQYAIDVVEYFAPVGKFHIYYRFLLRNAGGKRVWQINVESDALNEASWAKAHPQEASQGARQYQLTGGDSDVRTDYHSFSGQLDYDAVKAQVIAIVKVQTVPFPGEAAGPG